MTKENKPHFLRIYGILLSISIVVAGICLIAGCLSIYYSGDHPYSREVVAQTFESIAIPVYLCLALTILSFVLAFIFPVTPARPKMEKPYTLILQRLIASRNLKQCDEAITDKIVALRKKRKQRILIRTIVILVTSAVFLVYALNGSNYHDSDINGSMIKAMLLLIPCVIVAFGYALFTAIANQKSIQDEIDLLQQLPASPADKAAADKDNDDNIDKRVLYTRYAILAIALIFLVCGFIMGGTADVLAKAINICTECIGLG